MLLPAILVVAIAVGCEKTGPDSNTQVFETAQQAAARIREKQLAEWNRAAAEVIAAERPDLSARSTAPFGLDIENGGVNRSVDLSPLIDRLNGSPGREKQIIRTHLRPILTALDQERLARMGFAAARKHLRPMLLSDPQLVDGGIAADGRLWRWR